MMLAQSQAASQQQAQMAAQQQTLMMGLITALVGAPKPDPLSSIVPLLQILKPDQQTAPFSEMISNMAAMKELIGGGGDGGGNDESFLSGAAKAMLPMLGKMVETGMSAQPPQVNARPMPPQPVRPNPSPAIAAPRPMPPLKMPPVLTPVKPKIVSTNPLIALIADDVTFMSKRGYPPELAADAVLQRIADNKVEESAIISLVVRFQTAPDWIEDLSKEGIDLRERREWATDFLAALIEQYSEGPQTDADSDRQEGSATNTQNNGGLGTGGV